MNMQLVDGSSSYSHRIKMTGIQDSELKSNHHPLIINWEIEPYIIRLVKTMVESYGLDHIPIRIWLQQVI